MHHFAVVCKSKKKSDSEKSKDQKKSEKRSDALSFEESSESEEEIVEMSLHSVNTVSNQDWIEKILINNKTVNFKLDTGAQCDVIPVNLANKLKLEIFPSKTKYIISYNNQKSKILGNAKP
jgi:hypothetical protein